jgi:hypothetical protein
VVVADDAQLIEHVPGEVRPAVVEGRQAEDPRSRFNFIRIMLMTLTRLFRPFIA